MSRSIMMRKYGLDETQVTQQLHSILGNFKQSTIKEAGGEEKKEVSNALRKLRFKYDNIHKFVIEKDHQLELLKKGVEKIAQEEQKVELDTGGTQLETEKAKNELAEVKFRHDFEQLYQNQYQHMLDRMKKDLISLQLQSNDLIESLKSKKIIYQDELHKQRKSKENKLQSRYKLDILMKNIDHEQKKRQERIISLQTSIRNKEEALQKRMDRVRRQSEIAEAAANENKDTNEIKLRENFMIQTMWSQFFKKKMNSEMKKSQQIEEAFQKIRQFTGNTDVQDIVHKFLTREQTYSQLLTAVNMHEQKLDVLRVQNEQKKQVLQQIQIQHANLMKESVQSTPSTSAQSLAQDSDSEIMRLTNEIQVLEKEVEQFSDRKKKVYLVTDQVGGWALRVLNKLNNQLIGADPVPSGKKLPLLQMFNQITDITCNQLEEFLVQNQSEDTAFITAKDFMNDFATEEFLTKNIRVRPVSGITTREHDDRQSEHISRNNLMLGEPTDDEEKFNKMVNLDMEDQRKKIKLQKDEFEKRKQIEHERKERAQAKKKQ